jgi:hypothetical protein
MKEITLSDILSIMKNKGYIVYEKDTKEYNLNIVGIRSKNQRAGKFDDLLFVFWKYQNKWYSRQYKITTDPGWYYLQHTLSPFGRAILKPGQYPGMWQIGLHRGKYKALIQVRPCVVLRDNDKDKDLDFNVKKEEKGLFGINLHRALKDITTEDIGPHSAGCQVHYNPKCFDEMMEIAEKTKENFSNSFTYTLLVEEDFN